MTLILNDETAGPGTHALVIGIGKYPYLVGGKGPQWSPEESMGQLTSPPASARAFADWAHKIYRNPPKPLRSLDLLLSEEVPTPYQDRDGTHHEVEAAVFTNIENAVRAWFKRGNLDEKSLLLFFFSGHGVSAGTQSTLLASDFGEDPAAPLSHAIDFTKLHLGLDKCAAREQCFFIDACRVATEELLLSFQYYGNPIIPGSARHAARARAAPAYYSAQLGTQAYGRKNRPSFFTEALLKAFDGAGADDTEGSWKIQSAVLNRGIQFQLRRVSRTSQSAAGQLVTVDGLTEFTFHHLDNRPSVPVDVLCDPDTSTGLAILRYTDGIEDFERDPPTRDPWELELLEGSYTFEARGATFAGGPFTKPVHVRPPFVPVRIKVP